MRYLKNIHAHLLFGCGLAASAARAQTGCVPGIAHESLTPSLDGVVNTLVTFDDGAGPAFLAGGSFPTLGNVARLNGTAWETFGGGLGGAVSALEVIADGTGPGGGHALYAGGAFAGGLARWTGTEWTAVTPSPGAGVVAIALFDDGAGNGPSLCVATQDTVRRLVNGAWQSTFHFSTTAPGGPIERLRVLDEDGPGPLRQALYVCSVQFGWRLPTGTSITSTSGVMRDDGQVVTALSGSPVTRWVKSAEVFDDGLGGGPALYISGHYSSGPNTVVRWNTSTQSWAGLGPRASNGDAAYALDVFADGVGARPRLYAVGGLADLAVSPGAKIAAWDGTVWTPIRNTAIADAQSVTYHLASRTGVVGAAQVPALLCVRRAVGTRTDFFAIVGCPRCPGDMDLDGTATIQDLFMYINAWLAAAPSADGDGNGLSVQDLFDFIRGWFVACN